MWAGNQNRASWDSPASAKQLMAVFRICNPDNDGKIQVQRLKKLATSHTSQKDSLEEITNVLNELDPTGIGTLSFKEFCAGIRTIRRRQIKESIQKQYDKTSMMSPTATTAASILLDEGSAGPENQHSAVGNGVAEQNKSQSQCSSLSDGENYEWNGEVVDNDNDSGISNLTDGRTTSPPSGINRHTWLRTSLRRSPSHNQHQDNLPNRRWGSFRHNGKRQQQLSSNALASQLYRSSSFNSSGRSSTCDTAEDMYSDASLEEDVHDLHHKFQVLQQQVGVLQDTANQNDERYTRAKSDNAALQARVIMLEEQLRDTELRADQRLQEEQRRARELLQRVEREKQLQLENAAIRLHAAETEGAGLKEELLRQRQRVDRLEQERRELQEQLQDMNADVIAAKELESGVKEKERRLQQEHDEQLQLIEELTKEIERLRAESRTPALPTTSPEKIRLEELHEELRKLRAENSQLRESNDELQGHLLHAGLEQGRKLTATENSLAAELEAMSQDENVQHERHATLKMQQALKEQQEVNLQLRCYIDGILLNIVENYPQLLEVKHKNV